MRSSTLAVLAVLAVGAGCSLNQEGVPPPANDIFFPSATLVDSSGRWLFVTNSNSDLRYNDGTLVVVDLQKSAADRARQDWPQCPSIGYIRHASEPNADYCCWDLLDTQVLNCDSRKYIDAASTVRIGSFAGTMVWQPFCHDPPRKKGEMQTACGSPDPTVGRVLVPVRGNSSITTVDTRIEGDPSMADARLIMGCTDPARGTVASSTCDDTHRVVDFVTPEDDVAPATPIRLPEEPYALAMDPAVQLLYVGHLRGGAISLIDVAWSTPTSKPNLIASFPNIFPPDGNGNRGVTSLTVRSDDPSHSIFATSRYLPRAVGLAPTAIDSSNGIPVQATFRNVALIGTGDTFLTNLPGSEFRGIKFLPDEPRAFVLQRSPPALVGFDITPNAEGRMSLVPVDVLETCSSPTFLDMYDAGGTGVRLFVTCYEGGQIYVFDPYVPRLLKVIEVGRGPAGLSFDAVVPNPKGVFAYSTGFGANNISVIDLLPGSPTEYQVVQRLGFPSPVPR
jgi:DNA-binding beta-propeller fold protein YncE